MVKSEQNCSPRSGAISRCILGPLTLNAFPWIVSRLHAGHVVALRSAGELPPEADADRRRLTDLGTRSLALVPLIVGGTTVGALSLATLHSERDWAPELVQRMRLLAEVFASALARRDADSALRESEERFRSMADTAPVLIWMSGTDKHCTFFNKTWLEFTGRSLEQELGDGWLEVVHPDDIHQCAGSYGEAFNARREFTLEYRLRRHDGQYRHVLDRGTPRFDGHGVFVGYIGCAYDITDLKEAEERPRRVLEAAPNAMIMVTREGRITLVNAAAEQMFGYTRQELIGRPIELLIPERFRDRHPGHRKDYAAEPAARSMGAGRELHGRRQDGREVPVEIGLTPIETPDGLFVLASIIDITARKEAELEAERHRAELAHVTRIATAGELATSLAHELNQPLTAILTNAQAAQRFLRTDPADLGAIRDILKDIVEDNSRAGDVIHRLRALVRKDTQEFAPIHIATVVHDVFALARSDALLRGNRVSLDVDPGLPTVLGDRVQLQQVLLNLLLNAFDAMTDTPADRRHTLMRAARDGGVVKVAVVDRGTGLSGPMLEQVFQPFFTTKRGGLGMGLSISRSIIHAHTGRLWAENNPEGGGATFYFTLPVDGG